MNEIAMERRCAAACREALARDGITHRACVMVLFAMALDGLSYVEAVKEWAEFDGGWDAHRWHTEICYHLLKAWITEAPGLYFDKKVEEVCGHAH